MFVEPLIPNRWQWSSLSQKSLKPSHELKKKRVSRRLKTGWGATKLYWGEVVKDSFISWHDWETASRHKVILLLHQQGPSQSTRQRFQSRLEFQDLLLKLFWSSKSWSRQRWALEMQWLGRKKVQQMKDTTSLLPFKIIRCLAGPSTQKLPYQQPEC